MGGFDLQKELDERKLILQEVKLSYLLWRVAAAKGWLDKTAKAEEMCLNDLKAYWGNSSRVEFNYENLELRCFGENNEFVLFEPDK